MHGRLIESPEVVDCPLTAVQRCGINQARYKAQDNFTAAKLKARTRSSERRGDLPQHMSDRASLGWNRRSETFLGMD